MATYATAFGEYTSDVQPSDWFGRWGTASSTWAVRDKTGFEGGKVLEHTATTSARRLLSWDAIDVDANRDNSEIAVRFRSSSVSSFQNQIHIRASGVAGTEQSYCALTSGANLQLWKFVGGVATQIGSTISSVFAINTLYWVRFRVNGTSLKVKIWADGENEPSAWNLEATDSAISAAGWVGTGANTSTGTRDFDFFSVGTNGDTAPITLAGGNTTTVMRESHAVVETLVDKPDPEARLSHSVVETLITIAGPKLRISHSVVEALVPFQSPIYLNLSQSVLETIAASTDPMHARLSQSVLEAVVPYVQTSAHADWREYKGFLRFSISGTDYGWGTVGEYRSARWHEGIIADWPEPTDQLRDEFGLSAEDRLRVTVADPDNAYLGLIDSLRGIDVDLELVTLRLKGTVPEEIIYRRKGTIDEVIRAAGGLELEIVDLDRTQLEAQYPSKRFSTGDFSELFTDDVGRPVPVVVGTALKVPFAYAVNNGGVGPWVYYGPEHTGTETITALTVYREGRIVSATEYTVSTATVNTVKYLTLTFTQEQVDFQGTQMAITADLQSTLTRNAVDEIRRLLTLSGVTPGTGYDSVFANLEKMWVDIGYVEPRTVKAIIDDLLLVVRGHLVRDPSGAWGLVMDRAKDVYARFDEDARDMVEVSEYRKRRRAKTIELEYYPNDARQLLELKHVISRDTGSSTGVNRYVAPYIREHETADRLLSYLKAKEQYAADARADIHDVQLPLGEVVGLTNSLLWTGEKSFIVSRNTRTADRNELDLTEYVASAYTYTPGSLPPDAITGYQPDYSLTPPEAPTSLQTTSEGVSVNEDGVAWAWVAVECRPPVLNWSRIMFAVKNTVTGETYIQQGEVDAVDGTLRSTRFAGLRPNISHELRAWAINASNIEGAVAGPVAFTTATYGVIPAAPASISVSQGVGKTIRVTWSKVDISNLRHYELQRDGVTIAFVKITEFVDAAVLYDTAYTYRARTIDSFGNVSVWTTSSPITITGNLDAPDILNGSLSLISSSSGGSASLPAGGGWVTVNTLVVNNIDGGRLIMSAGFVVQTSIPAPPSSGNSSIDFQMLRDAGVISSAGGVWAIPNQEGVWRATLDFTHLEEPPGTSHTYTVQLRESGSGVTTSCTTSEMRSTVLVR